MTRPNSSPPLWRIGALVTACVLVVLGATVLDLSRASDEALEDFASEQVTLAGVGATLLSSELATVRRDALRAAEESAEGRRVSPVIAADYLSVRVRDERAPVLAAPEGWRALTLTVPTPDGRAVDLVTSVSRLLRGVAGRRHPDELQWLVLPPGATTFYTADGRQLDAPLVARALAAGRQSVPLGRPAAQSLGLSRRTALAGLARADGGPLGQWGLAVVASRGRERDRQSRGQWRLLLGQLLTVGLMMGFAGFARRSERRHLEALRRLDEAELEREREGRLERESRAAAMVTLAGGVAHEVSSPLSVISGRAELLLARPDADARARRGVEVILSEVEHIRQVIRGFLDLARGAPPPMAPIAPHALVRNALALVEHRFAHAGVALAGEVSAGLPSVRGDARLLGQALVNLLLNACDACETGGRVEVGASAEGGYVTFTVLDDGSGISEADAARAVEPFFTTKPAGKGTGLGLAIANEILKIHRGSLAVAPRAAGGTRAALRVPISSEEADATT